MSEHKIFSIEITYHEGGTLDDMMNIESDELEFLYADIGSGSNLSGLQLWTREGETEAHLRHHLDKIAESVRELHKLHQICTETYNHPNPHTTPTPDQTL